MRKIFSVVGILILIGIGAFLYWRSTQTAPVATEITALQSSQGAEGFARVTEPRAMQFPQDHGPHPDFQTEWWYYTGNLQAKDGRRFGYQLTFFRRGITPGDVGAVPCACPNCACPNCACPALGDHKGAPLQSTRASDWATNQIYFAHFAITDAKNNVHNETEIFSRGAAGLAGASSNPFRVWIENWLAEGLNRQAARPESSEGSNVKLVADDGKMALDLNLNAIKPPVVHGANGVSQKTDAVGNASYYVSFTRVPTQGTLRINGESIAVTGTSWFDHEWGTISLGANAAGWDWFSIQLDDNRELMFFQIRNKDGSVEPFSSGTLVEADGTAIHLTRDDVTIAVLNTWTSSVSQGKYPSQWRVTSRKGNFDLPLTPLIADQEMRVSFTYWEGAVNIEGASNGKTVRGQGYVEMTGYAKQVRGDVGY
ncbi:MAG: carotenoid 1,2-hydratase [Chloroflexi bacterium]|nr:carotenoid 1,2-hydratase [Chloroflexota bacterium]